MNNRRPHWSTKHGGAPRFHTLARTLYIYPLQRTKVHEGGSVTSCPFMWDFTAGLRINRIIPTPTSLSTPIPLSIDSSGDEHKDDAEALPEHELRLRSAMVISSNYSLLWQYLDPSQLLPKLLDKFLIIEEDKEEAETYSRYAQTSVILRGLFDDYCPPNRLFKLCDTLDTIPGQEHLGEKLLQGTVHPLQV